MEQPHHALIEHFFFYVSVKFDYNHKFDCNHKKKMLDTQPYYDNMMRFTLPSSAQLKCSWKNTSPKP